MLQSSQETLKEPLKSQSIGPVGASELPRSSQRAPKSRSIGPVSASKLPRSSHRVPKDTQSDPKMPPITPQKRPRRTLTTSTLTAPCTRKNHQKLGAGGSDTRLWGRGYHSVIGVGFTRQQPNPSPTRSATANNSSLEGSVAGLLNGYASAAGPSFQP